MGLPSSGLLHPGQIQIWFPHSSRICGNINTERKAFDSQSPASNISLQMSLTHHVGTDGLGYYTTDRCFDGHGGGQHGSGREQRRRRGWRWERRGRRGLNGYNWREDWGRRRRPRPIPWAGLGHGSLGCWRPGL